MRALARGLAWLAFVPAAVGFGLLAAACFGAAVRTGAVPP